MADLSILLPHKRDPENDKALSICLDCILKNTVSDYELLIDTTTPADPYRVYNRLAARANASWVVMINSDTFLAPGWDAPMLEAADRNTIVTGVLVEPGCIGCAPVNLRQNFGMTPDTFNRAAFEIAVRVGALPVPPGDGWYMPCLMNKIVFFESGGFDLGRGKFPDDPLDMYYWEAWRAAGRKVQRVPSYAYHLQHYSDSEEQKRGMRHE